MALATGIAKKHLTPGDNVAPPGYWQWFEFCHVGLEMARVS